MVRIINDTKLDFKDVLIVPKRSTLKSRSEVELRTEYTFRNSRQTWSGVPIMAANMDTTGTFEIAEALFPHGLITCIHKHYTVEEWVAWASSETGRNALPNVAISTGSGAADLNKIADIISKIPDIPFICMDVANGYSEFFVDAVRTVRASFPTKTIIAGNVVTGEMVEELILSGADIVKVGIGPGSVCTTRKQTGVGYPQLSAIIECADAAHGLHGMVVGDGGLTCPGDFSKAFGAGADFLMVGGMFAGHDESAGELIEIDNEYYKKFYGMSSNTAMKKHVGGVAEYRSSEGKTVLVKYRGPIHDTVIDILGGVRSTCTYVGAKVLRELSTRTTFIRVSQQLNHIFGTADVGKIPPPPPTSPKRSSQSSKKI